MLGDELSEVGDKERGAGRRGVLVRGMRRGGRGVRRAWRAQRRRRQHACAQRQRRLVGELCNIKTSTVTTDSTHNIILRTEWALSPHQAGLSYLTNWSDKDLILVRNAHTHVRFDLTSMIITVIIIIRLKKNPLLDIKLLYPFSVRTILSLLHPPTSRELYNIIDPSGRGGPRLYRHSRPFIS